MCRLETGIRKEEGLIATLVVFLKTSEEAVCDDSVCSMTMTSSNMP